MNFLNPVFSYKREKIILQTPYILLYLKSPFIYYVIMLYEHLLLGLQLSCNFLPYNPSKISKI